MLVQALYTRSISPTRKRPVLFCRWVGISPRSSSLSGNSSRARKRRGVRRKRNGCSFSTWRSMILTVVAIPSLSMECYVESLGMERAEWGEFRIGSQSSTLQTRSRHTCSEGGYCGPIHNGQPAGPRYRSGSSRTTGCRI